MQHTLFLTVHKTVLVPGSSLSHVLTESRQYFPPQDLFPQLLYFTFRNKNVVTRDI